MRFAFIGAETDCLLNIAEWDVNRSPIVPKPIFQWKLNKTRSELVELNGIEPSASTMPFRELLAVTSRCRTQSFQG